MAHLLIEPNITHIKYTFVNKYLNMFEDYLLSTHKEDLVKILEDAEVEKHFSITINFVNLFEKNTELGNNLLKEPIKTLSEFEQATRKVQTTFVNEAETHLVKSHVHIRISGLPACPELHRTIFPTSHDLRSFLQVSGTVVRITSSKMLEFQRQYMCLKCKYTISVEADYEQRFVLQAPKKCSNPNGCEGKNVIPVKTLEHENCKDYQEIKLQEQVSKLSIGSMPTSMWVTLEDDLVDCCKPGDDVTVCGIVMRRWKPLSIGKKLDIELVLRANHVQVNNDQRSIMLVTPEIKSQFRDFWESHKENPMLGRDTILQSFCPQIYGLYLVKLAIAVILAGGSRNQSTDSGIRIRSEPHLLLVGDPGTGKSQMLRFASKVIPRSVLTTGIGSTSAGLTVTAVMENGEWQLEAGALVLSDGGICCIDEFNSMKEHDRASIHEAMEQQTISVAKASMVCKLSTRCSILAATNPKGHIDPAQSLNLNIALASPLLSRFDLVLMLRDTMNAEWDEYVCDHIFDQYVVDFNQTECGPPWTIELLQAYYIIIKTLHPVLTENANIILSSYYQAQRQAPCRNVARTTVRLLDSLVRLSQAHARFMFRNEVLIMDAVMAIALIESSMQGAALLLPANIDTLHASFPDDPTENYIQLLSTILIKLNLPELLDQELQNMRNNTDDKPKVDESKNNVVDVTISQIKRMNNFSIITNKKTNNNFGETSKVNIETNKPLGDLTKQKSPKNNSNYIENDNVLGESSKSNKISNKLDMFKFDESKRISNTKSISKHIEATTKLSETSKRKCEITPTENMKKSKTSKKIQNDLKLINSIPSVNDIYKLDDLDYSFTDEQFDDCINVNSTKINDDATVILENKEISNYQISCDFELQVVAKPDDMKIVTTQERKKKFEERMVSLRAKFEFQPKKKTPEKIEETNKDIEKNSAVTNLERDESQSDKNATETQEIHKDCLLKNSSENNDRDSQSSQLSAKTLFQNPDEDIDNLDLDL